MRFLSKDEALKAMQLFGAANENEKISKSVLKDWVVITYLYIIFFFLAFDLLIEFVIFFLPFVAFGQPTKIYRCQNFGERKEGSEVMVLITN